MTVTRLQRAFGLCLGAGLFLAILFTPEFAAAQCVGASAVEDFAANMKGCAGTFDFTTRASRCALGWHVCAATEWTSRFAGKTPTYDYWTNDNLRYDEDINGCFVSFSSGTVCSSPTTPMRVCTAPRGDRDGVYGTPTRFYALQTLLPDGSISLVTAINRATRETQSFAGPLSANAFSGILLGGAGSLTMIFATGDSGTDGTATFVKIANPTGAVDDFTPISDPLGNQCNWHNCGLDTAEPNLYFGGCNTNTTAGVLCCQ